MAHQLREQEDLEVRGDLKVGGNIDLGGTAELGAATSTYTVTNHVEDRTMDANASSEAELRDVVGSIIKDLIAAGILTGSVSA